MSISFEPTYTTSIVSLERDPETGFVSKVIWALTATYTQVGVSTDGSDDKEYRSRTESVCNYERQYDGNGDLLPLPDDFIEYNNLDEATVLGWVSDTFPENEMTARKVLLKNNISKRMTPKVLSGVPW